MYPQQEQQQQQRRRRLRRRRRQRRRRGLAGILKQFSPLGPISCPINVLQIFWLCASYIVLYKRNKISR